MDKSKKADTTGAFVGTSGEAAKPEFASREEFVEMKKKFVEMVIEMKKTLDQANDRLIKRFSEMSDMVISHQHSSTGEVLVPMKNEYKEHTEHHGHDHGMNVNAIAIKGSDVKDLLDNISEIIKKDL